MKSENNLPEYDLIGYIRFSNRKVSLFRNIINKLLKHRRNAEKVTAWHLGKKADSLGNFSEKISKLVGVLLWIIVLLNLIITFLIYKIIF